MRKKRVIWTVIMLAVMALSLATMFLPWSRGLSGPETVLPGSILRRVLAVVVTLVFAVSAFMYFTRRTAWGMLYALAQGVNLFAIRRVTQAANTEAGAALYDMTAWYKVCVFLTLGILFVWLIGLFLGAWKRPAVKHQADSGSADAPREARKLFGAKKEPRGNKAPAGRQAAREKQDEEYDEALAIAEEAERMQAKAEAARKAAEASEAPEQRGWGEASVPQDRLAQEAAALQNRFAQEAAAPQNRSVQDTAAPQNRLAQEAAAPQNRSVQDTAASQDFPSQEAAEPMKHTAKEAAAFFMGDILSQEEAVEPEEDTIVPEAGSPLTDRTGAESAAPEQKPSAWNMLAPEEGSSLSAEETADEKGPAAWNTPAPEADNPPQEDKADEEEENDYLDAPFAPVGGKSAAAEAGRPSRVTVNAFLPEEEEPDEGPMDDAEEEADEEETDEEETDEEKPDAESGDEEEEPGEDKNDDFMEALGGFLSRLFAATRKGASRAATGIRTKAAEARARRKTEDELAAEEELAEEDDLAEEGASAEGYEAGATSPEAVARAIMPDADEGASYKAEEKKASPEGDDKAGKKEGFRIFGRVQRDEVEEEPEFLRRRRKKNKARADMGDRRPGFIPSMGLLVKAGIGLAVVLLAVLGVFLLVRRFRLETIDLEKYVVISSSGYEGYGVAEIKVDREALEKAVADALVSKGQIKIGTGGAVEAFRAFESYNIIMEQLGYTVDKDDHLSNGDVVTVSFVCDNTVLKEFGLKAGPESMTHTVRGLKVVRNYSPFDSDLIVEFTGTEPYGRIILTWAGDYPLHFTKSQSDGLSNGDVVVVTALPNDGYDEESLAVEYGIILTETTREYPVTGLSNYISSVTSLSGSVLTGLEEEAQAIIKDKAAGDYGKNETLAASERVGSLILTGSEETEARNYLYMVYKLTYERGKTTFDYYYYVRFRNVILHTDGSYEKDETSEIPTGRHGLFGLLDNDDALRIDWLHAVVGFETIEDFYTKKVADKVGTFTVSTDLGIEGIPAEALTPGGSSESSSSTGHVISPDPSASAEGAAGTGESAEAAGTGEDAEAAGTGEDSETAGTGEDSETAGTGDSAGPEDIRL